MRFAQAEEVIYTVCLSVQLSLLNYEHELMTGTRITKQKFGFTTIFSLLIVMLILAGSCKSDGETSLYSGVYSEGMEHMAFSPRGKDVNWWVNQPPGSLQSLIDRSQQDMGGSVLTIVEGELSEKGAHGHLGKYPRKLTIRDVLARQISIPGREHGYNNFESTVIASPDELRAFLQRTGKGKLRGWNERSAFEQAIKRAGIDFQHERLVVFRHTESSGSNRVKPRLSVSGNGVMRLTIDREEPAVGTADMAYYAFAFAVDTRRIKKAIKVVGDQEKEQFEFSRDTNDKR